MMKRLLMTTALASFLAMGAAYAQDAQPSGGQQPGQPVVATPQPPADNSGGGNMNSGATGSEQTPQTAPSASGAPGTDGTTNSTATAAPVSPPPSDAVVSAQSANEVRADQMIGMNVYNAQGEKIGTVHDILLDKDGKATGVVLSIGGVLGIGAKSVGLTWKEIDMKPDQQAVQVSYTKEQLEAAPDFKTSDQINSEMNAQQPANGTGAPAMPPASGTGGTPNGSSQ
ncbi:MAG TPA: PRC-barrel domain-containing protein [Candidatus Cybelea sp.]|nr:PRC-barrel domain-containing protein [Candidatus Cybelea sp.]